MARTLDTRSAKDSEDRRKWGATEEALRKAERKAKLMGAGSTRERSDSKRIPQPPSRPAPAAASALLRNPGAENTDPILRALAMGTARPGPGGGGIRAADAGIPSLSGVDAMTAPDPLEALLASLPPIDIANYVGPYDQAMGEARKTQEEAVPYIGSVYDELRQKLQGTQKDFAEQSMGINVGLQDTLRDRMAALNAAQAPVVGDVNAQAGGEMNSYLQSQLQGELGAQRGQLQTNATQQQGLVDRLAEVRAQGNQDRLADTHTAQGAAVANSKNNLQGVLDKLGIARAGAERDFTADTQERGVAVQKARMDYLDQQARAAEDAAKAQREAAEEEKKYAKEREAEEKAYFDKNAKSGRERFDETLGERQVNNPKAYAAFESLVGEAGKGAAGRSVALAKLAKQQGSLASGENPWGARLKPEVIRDWIEAYYDEEKRL